MGVMKLRILRLENRAGPKAIPTVLIRKRWKENRHRKRKCAMTTGAEIGVTWPQAKECEQPSGARTGNRKQIVLWSFSREHSPVHTLIP